MSSKRNIHNLPLTELTMDELLSIGVKEDTAKAISAATEEQLRLIKLMEEASRTGSVMTIRDKTFWVVARDFKCCDCGNNVTRSNSKYYDAGRCSKCFAIFNRDGY